MAKGVGGKKSLKFSTTQDKNTKKRRIIISLFSLLVIIIATVSLVVISREYNIFDKEEPTSEGEETPTPTVTLQDYVTVMFSGVSTSKDRVMFISFITLNTKDKTFAVDTISPSLTYSGKSLSDIYADKGEEELAIAAGKVANYSVDRYVVVTEKRFKAFMNALGSFELDLKEKIDYSDSDFSLNLLSGKQTLTGDKLFKYIRYKGLGSGDSARIAQAEVIGEIVSQKLNESNTSKGEELFGRLVNNSISNITILDFSKYSQILEEISKSPRSVEAVLHDLGAK